MADPYDLNNKHPVRRSNGPRHRLSSFQFIVSAAVLWVALVAGFGNGVVRAESGSCDQPSAVCEVRGAVFRIAGFDPFGSAVRLDATRLVTSRHLVADNDQVDIFLDDKIKVSAKVIPTDYPGDLILLETDELPEGPFLVPANVRKSDVLYAVGADVSSGDVRAYRPGEVLLLPAPNKPLGRLHHSAFSQPGNSGGALVRKDGSWVGILASGGDGRFEAVPVGQIESLKGRSGSSFLATSKTIGKAIKSCTAHLETGGSRRKSLSEIEIGGVTADCLRTGNRQFFDLAAQLLGRLGYYEHALDLFRRSLDQDPSAINSRLGLVVTLHSARRYKEEVPHLEILLEHLPENIQVLWFALQAGVWTGDEGLVAATLAKFQHINPGMAQAARRFVNSAKGSQPR